MLTDEIVRLMDARASYISGTGPHNLVNHQMRELLFRNAGFILDALRALERIAEGGEGIPGESYATYSGTQCAEIAQAIVRTESAKDK